MSDCWPKIWGKNVEVYANDLNSVNVLRIKKGGTCSCHSHKTKHNIFHVIEGTLVIDCPEMGQSEIKAGQSFTVFAGTIHFFQALEDTIAIEIMFVKYDGNDIDRKNIGSIQNVDEEK